ncbi:hypothetical protein LCGC14_1053990 [marine sediment metagenome]|uniref:Uncharacterized protein n=1 Tax=marine sediment metagenome TaxID=412755 RepID=A0A0F9MMY8_9ZZZZ
MFTLVDDGTLDTVLECDECQDAVVEQALADAKETHECPK